MSYRFAAGLKKESVPALLARDSGLSAECLRVAFALFHQVMQSSKVAAELRDIQNLTGLSPEQARAALMVLRQAGYIEGDAAGAPPPFPSFRSAHQGSDKVAPFAAATTRRDKGGRLDAGIMDYEMDIDGLIRAGDASVRGTAPAQTAKRIPGLGGIGTRPTVRSEDSTLDPLMSDNTQPAGMRLMIWLRFVLGTGELEACERFALDYPEEWNTWVECFIAAKAVAREDELLEDIRARLAEVSPSITLAPPKPGASNRRSRTH
ncbi:MAG: hypothetical protein OEO83_15400 [Alphaproteobacteria bacterium]|nr:hypothetical protein [Alphaproteobacteria bacterium]